MTVSMKWNQLRKSTAAAMSLIVAAAVLTTGQQAPAYAAGETVTVSSTIKGKTPQFLGINPGSQVGYEDHLQYGDPNTYGTHGFWLKQLGSNMARAWGHAVGDESITDSPINRNDTTPDGDGVDSEATYQNRINAVIANPLGNPYINWSYFNRLKMVTINEMKQTGSDSVAVLRYKHGGNDNFPSYMGGYGVPSDQRDPGLLQWKHKREWWEHSFAMAYLFAKDTGTIHFEIGNEPEYGSQGGLTIEQQVNAIKIAAPAIREGVKAALGTNSAYIMSAGTNHANYAQGILAGAASDLDALSVHAYETNNVTHLQNMLSIAAGYNKPVFMTEAGSRGNSTDNTWETVARELFDLMNIANANLKSMLYFKTVGGAHNGMLLETSQVGLLQPTRQFYLMRMLFRAGQNAKDVYNASSTDADLIPLVTKDSGKTYFTIRNKATTSKTYTIALPAFATGSRQNVFLFDGGSNLDKAWNGVSSSGSTITVTNQPANSYVQIVYGSSPVSPAPVAYDETQYQLGHLSQVYLPSSRGSVVSSYSDTFTNSSGKLFELADKNKWVARNTDTSHAVVNLGSTTRGTIYDNRLHLSNTDRSTTTNPNTLWHVNQVSMNSSTPIVLTTDIGFDDSNGNTDPKVALIYRDNNGNMLALRAFPNSSNGKWTSWQFTNPQSPNPIFAASTSDTAAFLGAFPSSNASLKSSQKVIWTITSSSIRMQLFNSSGTQVFDSTKAISVPLSGTGRIGLAKVGAHPLWFDNMTITGVGGGAPDTTPPAAPTGLSATASGSSQINVSWNANTESDLASYNLYRSTTSGFTPSSSNRIQTGLTSTTFANTGLTASTTYYYKVTAVDTSGNESTASSQASATTGSSGGSTVTLATTADAYVRGGTDAGNNFGAVNELQAKYTTDEKNVRHSYLKFDLSTISGSITSVKLRLNGSMNATQSNTIVTSVFPVSNTSWSESTINFTNRPSASGSALANATIQNSTTPQWYEWDITSYVQAEKAAGRNTISLMVSNPAISTSYVRFNSKEASSNQPQLVVITN